MKFITRSHHPTPGIVRYLLVFCVVALALGASARADDSYPSRPVRIISPYAAGGTPDIVARGLAEQLTLRLKQNFIVENRTGANGTIASEMVAASQPDGYTLLLASDGPIVIMPLLQGGEDPLKRLVPVNLSAQSAFVLMARSDLGVHSLADVVALAKKQRLTFGSAGVGSQHHLAGELFKSRAGIDLVHVPYKGSVEAITDLVGKRIDLMFGGVPPALPFIAAHAVVPIAVTSETRSHELPSVPTFAEEGYPGYRVLFWAGIMAPAGTPNAVVEKLNDAASEALRSPDVIARFEKIGAEVVNAGPASFAQRLEADRATWGALIRQTGLSMQ
jgi:tripartite-type tricarboxylate transporter receptor subunit TctC